MTFLWIWIAALIIEILLVNVVGFMMVGIVFWTFTAVFIWCLIEGFAANNSAVWGCAIYTAVVGLLIFLSDVIQNLVDTQLGIEVAVKVLIFGWSMGGIFLWVGLYMGVIEPIKCTMKVNATCVEYQAHWGKYGTSYSPVFAYKMQGNYYRNSTGQLFSHKKIERKFRIGQEYQIYADPREPMMICTKRTIGGGNFLMLLIGILMILSAAGSAFGLF